jgi:hypothetical protein
MSNMLEQAIIDATALKEAALKNAENLVIEKYSNEIKEVVQSLLEQPEDELEGFADVGGEVTEPPSEFVDQLPDAAMEGEDLCPCPDEDEEIEIDFDALAAQIDGEQGEVMPSDMMDREAIAGEMALEEGGAAARSGNEDRDVGKNRMHADRIREDEDTEENASDDAEIVQEDEEVELEEDELAELLNKLAEDLSIDMEPASSGWLEKAETELNHQRDIAAIAEDAAEEELEEDNELAEQVAKLEADLQKVSENNKKYKDTIVSLKEHLDKVNLSNARLLYTNRILTNTSLNERQKDRLVEAITKAGTIEEAKVVYETLQSTVGSTSSRRRPKSLSEAVTKRSSLMVSGRRDSGTNKADPAYNRMKVLAGLVNNKT